MSALSRTLSSIASVFDDSPKPLLVAGIMSGTSADGIDVALCRIGPGDPSPKLELLTHEQYPYPPEVREAVLRAATDAPVTVPELAHLNWRLGELYAEAVLSTCAGLAPDQQPDLIGLHGQTIYHQATAADFLGAPTRATWQLGEPAVLAERLRVPVVSDFRTADFAAGGQGAPLVPMLDFHYFRSPTRRRILLNLGGIANVTVLPAGCTLGEVTAFDTGPANMVLDALAHQFLGRDFDADGAAAARGRVLTAALAALLEHPYFAKNPPKSCGREQFGSHYAAEVLALCRRSSATITPDILATDVLATGILATDILTTDVLATAAELTVQTIVQAVLPFAEAGTELIASGGGTRNRHLMNRLRDCLLPHGILLHTTDDCDLPSPAKEAAAFALLAWLTWHRLPGNVPSATGATHPAILGRITCV